MTPTSRGLAGTTLGDLLKANGGDFFVDSHATDPWGAVEELWSSGMKTEFQARAGYDIMPDLAALFDPPMLGSGLGGVGTAGPYFSFSDGTGNRIRSDFNRVRSTMFTQYRLVPFQNWSKTYNMPLRIQLEDGPVTSTERPDRDGERRRPARVRVAHRRRPGRQLPVDGVGQPHERQHLVLDRVLRRPQRELRRRPRRTPSSG